MNENDTETRRCRLCGIENADLRHLFAEEHAELLHKFQSTFSALVSTFHEIIYLEIVAYVDDEQS